MFLPWNNVEKNNIKRGLSEFIALKRRVNLRQSEIFGFFFRPDQLITWSIVNLKNILLSESLINFDVGFFNERVSLFFENFALVPGQTHPSIRNLEEVAVLGGLKLLADDWFNPERIELSFVFSLVGDKAGLKVLNLEMDGLCDLEVEADSGFLGFSHIDGQIDVVWTSPKHKNVDFQFSQNLF